jgi:hypothetical protein
VPAVLIVTQLLKLYFNIPGKIVPTVALLCGLAISIFISHKHDFVAGLFMGWFYGYAAIGSYSSLKASIKAYRSSST